MPYILRGCAAASARRPSRQLPNARPARQTRHKRAKHDGDRVGCIAKNKSRQAHPDHFINKTRSAGEEEDCIEQAKGFHDAGFYTQMAE
jgi:hypothetical protein